MRRRLIAVYLLASAVVAAGLDGWYDTVHREEVPAGVRLVSVMHPGMESAQAPCTTDVTVDPGTSIDVTVFFWPRDDGTCATVGTPVARSSS